MKITIEKEDAFSPYGNPNMYVPIIDNKIVFTHDMSSDIEAYGFLVLASDILKQKIALENTYKPNETGK
jgi:hypothetical protein